MKRLIYRPWLVYAALLLLPAVGTPGRAEDQSARLAEIPKAMLGFVENHQISGAVTLVAKDGRVAHLEAVGLADVEGNRPMQKDSMFCIASMTKPITATALMILEEEGRLALSDPVSRYIPAFEKVKLDGKSPARPITLFDLVTHTSGLGGS